jgi:UDP-2,3-diacylglucosamine pyrophosphatase LpxH
MPGDPDTEAVRRLGESPPARILVASDFHLGAGWDPVTDTCVATENFLADGAFAAWLSHHAPDAAGTLLILNGDIFDVLRVTAVPRTAAELGRWSARLADVGLDHSPASLRAGISKSEERYGLKTHDHKTIWKLMVIADGHGRFFDALAAWVRAQGRVLFLTGNHDVELHWPKVREAIRRELADRGAGAGAGDRIAFADEHVVIDNLHVEHGHRFDDMTAVVGPPELPGGEEINLPLGSFVNRYFINRVEALDPFIDNVKPVQQSLLRLARQRPIKILGTYFGAWRFLRRAVAKRRLTKSVLLLGLGLLLPLPLAALLLLAVPGVQDAVLGRLPGGDVVGIAIATLVGGGVLTALLPYLAGAAGELLRRRRPVDHHLDGAREAVGGELGRCGRSRAYVCMGHTHVTAVKRIDEAGTRLYLNTGTWIALWPRDRPDLLGRTVYSYALFEATAENGYTGRVLAWDPHADRPGPAVILVPAAA